MTVGVAGCEVEVEDAAVRSMVRIERADGTSLEFEWDDSTTVRTRVDGPDADATSEEIASFDRNGAFVMQPVPDHLEQRSDPYGSLVERAIYADGTTVEHDYDDEIRLRGVRVRGAWGSQQMEVRPDGRRSLRWAVAGLQGTRSWDAGGSSTSKVEFPETH